MLWETNKQPQCWWIADLKFKFKFHFSSAYLIHPLRGNGDLQAQPHFGSWAPLTQPLTAKNPAAGQCQQL